jgi:predicted nucleotidyltransferase
MEADIRILQFGLKQRDILKINNVFAGYPHISKAIVYGSRAKGNYKNGSDIDLVLVGDLLNSAELNKIHNALDDLLLPYTFDLAIYSKIDNPDLLEHIKRVGMVFYQS